MQTTLSPVDKLRAAGKYLQVRLARRPIMLSLEVTKRCNARCDFCDYWKITDRDENMDFTDVVHRFDPMSVVFTGGEPMLRRDLPHIVESIRALPGFRYLTLLTHGGFLDEERIRALVEAGIHQINVSLNYPDARQDRERGIPGLFARLEKTIPKMVAEGYRVFTLATVLMADNMGEAEALVRLAHAWGINIAFSGYNDLKNGNRQHIIPPDRIQEFRDVCRRLIQIKRDLKNVMTSDYLFERLPDFYERGEIAGCRAGQIMIHVSPKGMVQPCAELPGIGHYRDFDPREYPGPSCGRCFDACRTELEAPLTVRRLAELTGLA